MPSGGARNRSGPQPDPQSLTSARRGLVFTALPREGYAGEAPSFPLASPSERELEVWAQSWRLPQAAAWAAESWRWRTVAEWVRWSVRMEDPEAIPGVATTALRLQDQIGLSPAGLKENGWAISRDEVKARRETPAGGTKAAAPRSSSRDRLTVVDAAAGE